MSISQQARNVIEQKLDRSRVKQKPGGKGMTFDFIPTAYAIELLNQAFDYNWNSRVFYHEKLDDTVIVGVELEVLSENGTPIRKQQFGSGKFYRGDDLGSAFKGAASDGLKKCASQFGIALELYQDDTTPTGFTPPQRPAPPGPPAKPQAPAKPQVPAAPRPVPAPPRPATPPGPKQPQGGNANTASVARPTSPAAPKPPAPPKPQAASASAARPNPFDTNSGGRGINSTQLAALTSLANKKGLGQPDLIALADVSDEQGSPKQSFEDLTHSEAIQVIKAAQK